MERAFTNCISMMSGTSLDGIDACLVKIGSDFSVEIIDSYSLDYPTEIKEKLLSLANNNGDVKDVCFLNFVVGELFAQCANFLLNKASLSSCISLLYASGKPLSIVNKEIKLPNTLPLFPRTSSAISGFFFWGIIDEPVE